MATDEFSIDMCTLCVPMFIVLYVDMYVDEHMWMNMWE